MVTKIIRMTADRLKDELDRLEREHRMSSVEFYTRLQAGTLAEHDDYVRWAWLCTVALRRGLLSVAPAYA